MARNLTHKIVYRPEGISEMYDLVDDPRELHNLWGLPRVASAQAAMVADLLSWLVQTADVTPMHKDSRQPPVFPHAASACAASGVDGPGEGGAVDEAARRDSLLSINGVEGFEDDGVEHADVEAAEAVEAASAAAAAPSSAAPCAGSSAPLYRCEAAPIELRADDLLGRMTVQQLIQQTWAPYGGHPEALLRKIGSDGVGQVPFHTAGWGGGTPAQKVEALNALQDQLLHTSGVPASITNEALHSALPGGTVFPELATQGATWDVALVHNISAAIAREARACGIDTAFAPVLNMWIDARFGRLQEGFSENPTLTAAFAVAAVTGLQGTQPAGRWAYFNESKTVALGKHYVAYGAAEGGLNGAPAELSERTLREWYLAPWRAFAAAGGKGVMASHQTVLNQPMHANPYVTNAVLRGELQFGDGIILSDCNDIPALVDFRVAANLSHAAARGIAGGVDLDLQCGANAAYTALPTALADGSVALPEVAQAARRVLMAKFALGLFDKPHASPAACTAALNTRAHRSLALTAAEEGIVLLKNSGGLLPLQPSKMVHGTGYRVQGAPLPLQPSKMAAAAPMTKPMSKTAAVAKPMSKMAAADPMMRIAVVGELGSCATDASSKDACAARLALLGSYSQFDAAAVRVETVSEALAAAVGSRGTVRASLGATVDSQPAAVAEASRDAAVKLARASDVVVAVLGDDLHTSSEWGDRDSLDLPGDQLPLLAALTATSTPVVAVLVTGRTATFGPGNEVLANVSALLSAFRPGQMGALAIAKLLLGEANPSGRLAQNWVRSAGQAMSGACVRMCMPMHMPTCIGSVWRARQ